MVTKKAAKSSPWASVRDRERQREEKMEAILLTAAKAFSEDGYQNASLDSIAERLGITKPTLYHYFSSKEELITRVSTRGLENIIDVRLLDAHASGLDQLRQTLRQYIEHVATDFGKCMVLLNDTDVGEPHATVLLERKRAIDLHIRELINKGKADGSIAPCDTRITAFMLAGAVNGVARWYREDGGLSPTALGEIYVNQMTSGLKPR